MINFFRKIRQRLLTENKFSKYLIYAIGEIILVVLGILIALQINNWNENQKTKKLERVYLESFIVDLEADVFEFNRRIKDSEDMMIRANFYINESYKTQKNFKDFKTLIDTLLWNSEHFVPQNSTYYELNNSGQLNIFSNRNLKDKILSHYFKYESVSSHIKEANEFSVGEMSKIISIVIKGKHTGDFINEPHMYEEMDWRFINDHLSQKFILLESAATVYAKKHKVFKNYFEELSKQSQLLIDQINEELKSRE